MRTIALTRNLISRAFPQPVGDDEAATRLLTNEEVAAHLDALLGERPGAEHELWLFAYGSLMWKPELDFAEQHVATVRGWHRRFCLWQWRYRGTRDNPGMMLALDHGGSCRGVVYKLTGPDIRAKIAPVWRREMIGNGYRPRWVTAKTDASPVQAIAFIAYREGDRYAGRLTDEAIADRIAAACGHIGPSAEYLLETAVRCEELGIHDRHLWRMQALVADRLQKSAAH